MIVAVLWLVAFLILILISLEIAIRFAPNYELARKLPGPEVDSVIGFLKFAYTMTPEGVFNIAREWARTYKQTYVTWALVKMTVEVIRAHEMEIILASSKHTEKGTVYDLLKPFMGQGLLTSNGKKWQQRRRILTPTFHFSILQQFLSVFKWVLKTSV